MDNISKKVEKILHSLQKKYTKQEAMEALRKCGVLTKDNEVVEAYKDIFVSKESPKSII